MQKVNSHSVARQNRVSFMPKERYKVATTKEVAILNPSTKIVETHRIVTYDEEPTIDPHLKASDFDLDVQIRNGVNLRDCGLYFEPSVEEYTNVIASLTSHINLSESTLKKLQESQQSPSTANIDVQPVTQE